MKPILRVWILLVSCGLIALVPGCGSVAASEVAVLNGRLFDSESRSPVAGALLVPQGRPERGTASGEDGRFQILWEDYEVGQVAVTAEGYLPAVVEVTGPDGELVLALRPAASLAGRVVEAQDRPLEGVAVGLEVVDLAALGRPSPEGTTVTASDGRFRFDGLEPGQPYRLRLARDGHVSRFRKLPELAARHYDAVSQ